MNVSPFFLTLTMVIRGVAYDTMSSFRKVGSVIIQETSKANLVMFRAIVHPTPLPWGVA